MPTKVQGSNVMHKVGGHWKVKQHCTSHTNAVKANSLLQGVAHGWKPTKRR